MLEEGWNKKGAQKVLIRFSHEILSSDYEREGKMSERFY